MKKLFSILCLLSLLIVALVSCDTPGDSHEHDFEDKWTLALGYYMKASDTTSNNPDGFTQNKQMAMGILMCIPPLVVFGCSQSLLIEGVSISGMKA